MPTLTCLTWNISASGYSSKAKIKTHQYNHELLIQTLAKWNADVICLQEVTDQFEELFLASLEYKKICSCTTHCDDMVIYVKKDMNASVVPTSEDLPILTIELELEGKKLLISTAHLCPGKGQEDTRWRQIRAVSLNDQPHILMGDLNIREAETEAIVNLGWTEGTVKKDYTWDSRLNHYHEGGFSFICRFDRILYRNLELRERYLIGNEPLDNDPSYYPSDHFGLIGKFEV